MKYDSETRLIRATPGFFDIRGGVPRLALSGLGKVAAMDRLFDAKSDLGQAEEATRLEAVPASELGAVFTRRWVADWILDEVGYHDPAAILSKTLIEPACGSGAFLIPAVERLLAAWRIDRPDPMSLASCIWACDLDPESVSIARKSVSELIEQEGFEASTRDALLDAWIRQDDFLLADDLPAADWVVGNPPYVRLEAIGERRLLAYRRSLRTLSGRADIYVGFFERGLDQLTETGALGFICADRWMHNAYGRDLRQKVHDGFDVRLVVKLHDVDCFEDPVSAYPALTVIAAGSQGKPILVETTAAFDEIEAIPAITALSKAPRKRIVRGCGFDGSKLATWFDGDMWPSGSPAELAVLEYLERSFETVESRQRSTRVSIGVATGNDAVYIPQVVPDIERDRLLPMVMAQHISTGSLVAEPSVLMINPWDENGLVDLRLYPKLEAYFKQHELSLRERHVGQKNPKNWFRTIDRVHPWLTHTPKILLADMKARITPVVEPGGFYPHHNVYWIVSDTWDLEVLAGLLMSDHANLMVSAYCVKMRGGTLRFQAQYLRRIRLPQSNQVTPAQKRALAAAYRSQSTEQATSIAEEVYGCAIPVA